MPDIPFVAPKPAFVDPIAIPGVGSFPTSGAESVAQGYASLRRGLGAVVAATQQASERLRQTRNLKLRARLEAIDRDMFSDYSEARRNGTFNADALQAEYEKRLTGLQTEFETSPANDLLFEEARSRFSRMLENELTRRIDTQERVRLLGDSLTVGREFEAAVAANPAVTQEDIDRLATEYSNRIQSVVNPAAAEQVRVRLFDGLLTSGQSVLETRAQAERDLRALAFKMGVQGQLDSIEQRVASGKVSAQVGIGAAAAVAKRLESLPPTKETVALSDSARNLQTELTRSARTQQQQAQTDTAKAQALALRIAVEERADLIYQLVADGSISPGQGSNELDKLAKELREGEITPTSVELTDAVRNLSNVLRKEQQTDDTEQQRLARRFRFEKEADNVLALVETGSLTPGQGAELIRKLTQAAEKGELSPVVVEVSDALRGINNSLLARQRKREESARKREREASVEATKLAYAQQQSDIKRMLTRFDEISYITEDDFLAATKEITDAAAALPESTVEQIRFKDDVYKRLMKGASRFTEERHQQEDDIKSITYDSAFNDLLQDIRQGNVRTSDDLSSRLEAIEAAVTEGGAPVELLKSIANGQTQAKTLYETVTHNRRFQPVIDEIAYAIDRAGPIPPEQVINLINSMVERAVGREGFTPRQADLLRTAAFRQLRPEYEEAMDARYDRQYASIEGRVTQEFSVASAAVVNDEEFNFDAMSQRIGKMLTELPEEMQRDIAVNVIEPSTAKLGAQVHDKELLARRARNKALLDEMIVNAGAAVREDPDKTQDQFQFLQGQINNADLSSEDATALLDEAQKVMLQQNLAGSVERMLEQPSKRDEVDEFIVQVRASPAFESIAADIDRIVYDTVREWRRAFNERSAAVIEERLQAIEGETFFDRDEVNGDPNITVADKVRYNKTFNEHNAAVIAGHRFQDKLDATDAFITRDDEGDYDAWWQSINGAEELRTNPQNVLGAINKAGFITPAMVKDIWSVVLNGETEDATNMLTVMSAMSPEVLATSLDESAHEQYVFWKYDRRAKTPEDSIVMLRSFHADANEQIRRALETEYTRLAFEESYANPDTIIDVLGLEDAPENSYGLNYAYRDFISLHRHFFLHGMDWGDAEDAATEMVRRDWGENLNGRAMYLPPSAVGVPKLFNLDSVEFDYSWIAQDLETRLLDSEKYNVVQTAPGIADAMRGRTISSVVLFADETTRRQHNSRQTVSYLVQYIDEQGLVQFVTENMPDGSERVIRYVPIPTDEMVQNQSSLIEEAQRRYDGTPVKNYRGILERAPRRNLDFVPRRHLRNRKRIAPVPTEQSERRSDEDYRKSRERAIYRHYPHRRPL